MTFDLILVKTNLDTDISNMGETGKNIICGCRKSFWYNVNCNKTFEILKKLVTGGLSTGSIVVASYSGRREFDFISG